MENELTYEMIKEAKERLRSKPPTGDIVYRLPSPNKGKMLMIRNNFQVAYEIWKGEKTADDFDFVEEVDIPFYKR